MINRLVLNLSRAANKKGDLTSTNRTYPNLSFVAGNVLGNIGAPLRVYKEEETNIETLENINDFNVELKMWQNNSELEASPIEVDKEKIYFTAQMEMSNNTSITEIV